MAEGTQNYLSACIQPLALTEWMLPYKYGDATKPWPNRTNIYCTIMLGSKSIFPTIFVENDSEKHADKKLVNIIEEKMEEKSSKEGIAALTSNLSEIEIHSKSEYKIEIRMNYSPCQDCCKVLQRGLLRIFQGKHFHVVIQFANFYKIYFNQYSCYGDQVKRWNGLRALHHTEGFEIKVFSCPEDWNDLVVIMKEAIEAEGDWSEETITELHGRRKAREQLDMELLTYLQNDLDLTKAVEQLSHYRKQ